MLTQSRPRIIRSGLYQGAGFPAAGRIMRRGSTFSPRGKSPLKSVLTSPLFWVMLLALAARVFCYPHLLAVTLTPDSPGYMKLSALFDSGARTPAYPLFIAAVRAFTGSSRLAAGVVLLQDVLLYLSVAVFYQTARLLFRSTPVVAVSSLVYGCLPCILNYSHVVIAESLSISVATAFFYCIVRYLREPEPRPAIGAGAALLVLVFLKPEFLPLLVLTLVFWALRLLFVHRDGAAALAGLLSAAVCAVLMLAYCAGYYVHNGIFAPGHISVDNALYKVTDWGMAKSGGDDAILRSLNDKLAKTHSVGLAQYDTELAYPPSRVSKFVNTAVRRNLPAYITRNLAIVGQIAGDRLNLLYAGVRNDTVGNFLKKANARLPVPFWVFYLLMLAEIVRLIVKIVRGPGPCAPSYERALTFPWAGVFSAAILILQFFTGIFGAQNDYARFLYPVSFLLILQVFYWIDLIVRRLSGEGDD